MVEDLIVLDFDSLCADRFGTIRARSFRSGHVVSPMDAMIAAVALVHDLTLVTHNTSDFEHIPDLRLEDWLIP